KILSYNVNGIRAAINKGLIDWLSQENPDVLCLQEVKAHEEQVDLTPIKDLGYDIFWMPAQKKGYSGVAIFTKVKPKHVEFGCGYEQYDSEGRLIRADFEDFSLMNVYMPSGSSGDERQAFKMQWLDTFTHYINNLKPDFPNLIICGDYNICHKPIDIHNPQRNKNTSGFLPEEREWFTKFIDSGFVDTFRHFNEEPHQYSWWTYRAGARKKNLGWRIDYHLSTESMKDRLKSAAILSDVNHSDHCPVLVEID
ncbi:exodeoxyribonuclease III, partial [Xanthovirga aplysinae]|uniref:exodeoxyribonuclease III n=1 Tax=Xanthovirga aplysinae TaxID=2529853 RepID=UPI0012BC9E24